MCLRFWLVTNTCAWIFFFLLHTACKWFQFNMGTGQSLIFVRLFSSQSNCSEKQSTHSSYVCFLAWLFVSCNYPETILHSLIRSVQTAVCSLNLHFKCLDVEWNRKKTKFYFFFGKCFNYLNWEKQKLKIKNTKRIDDDEK